MRVSHDRSPSPSDESATTYSMRAVARIWWSKDDDGVGQTRRRKDGPASTPEAATAVSRRYSHPFLSGEQQGP
jgi:hypothetical protein